MCHLKLKYSLVLCATVSLLSHTAFALEIAPAPPAEDGSPAAAPVEEPLPLPADAGASCVAISNGCCDVSGDCCDYTPGATCCDVSCYRCCCCGHPCCYMPGIHHRKRNGKLCWCRVWTTGDMYPHYAYMPAHGGYYYFRPYNYTNVLQHKADVCRLGGEANHPYSVAMFDGMYDAYYMTHEKLTDDAATAEIPGASKLPNLEDLLNAK